jgi:hypothetical protein
MVSTASVPFHTASARSRTAVRPVLKSRLRDSMPNGPSMATERARSRGGRRAGRRVGGARLHGEPDVGGALQLGRVPAPTGGSPDWGRRWRVASSPALGSSRTRGTSTLNLVLPVRILRVGGLERARETHPVVCPTTPAPRRRPPPTARAARRWPRRASPPSARTPPPRGRSTRSRNAASVGWEASSPPGPIAFRRRRNAPSTISTRSAIRGSTRNFRSGWRGRQARRG